MFHFQYSALVYHLRVFSLKYYSFRYITFCERSRRGPASGAAARRLRRRFLVLQRLLLRQKYSWYVEGFSCLKEFLKDIVKGFKQGEYRSINVTLKEDFFIGPVSWSVNVCCLCNFFWDFYLYYWLLLLLLLLLLSVSLAILVTVSTLLYLLLFLSWSSSFYRCRIETVFDNKIPAKEKKM